jgi:hypothetical protein
VNFIDSRDWLRRHGGEIRQLADRGHHQAQQIILLYTECYRCSKLADRQPFDQAAASLRAIMEDFIRQDLIISARAELRAKFGYKDDEKPPAPGLIIH